jgi:hypothetical protein
MLRQDIAAAGRSTQRIEAMSGRYLDNSDFGREPRVSAEFVLSTLLVLALVGAGLLWAYLGPRPISPSFRATIRHFRLGPEAIHAAAPRPR